MIGHHFVTGSLAYFGLHPYLHYYGMYYFGIAELTNIPLTIMDVFKYFKHWAERYPSINGTVRTTFGVSFIILRLILWPIYSYPFWVGSLSMLYNGTAHSSFVVAYFLLANLFLTGLQFLWGSKIFSSILFKKPKKLHPKASDWLEHEKVSTYLWDKNVSNWFWSWK